MSCPSEKTNPGYGLEQDQIKNVYNASSRITIAGSWNAFASASFIYWLPREKGLEIATSYDLIEGFSKIIDIEYKYKPGFQVGVGFNFNHDKWVVDLGYTRFHANEKKSYSSDEDLVIYNSPQFKFDNQIFFDSVHGKWKLHMDLLEINLSRPFYSGRHLTITPTAGIRGGWINQQLKIAYAFDGDQYHFYGKQNSWIVGPKAGVNGKWLLGKGFRFFGDCTAALLYQRFHIHPLQETDFFQSDTNYIESHQRRTLLTPYAAMDLGFGYGAYFAKNKWHIDIALLYEFQIYWEQNHLRYLNNDLNVSETLRGYGSGNAANLLLHGLNLTVRLDF